jgi:glycosyltransferase involved in cell wall biosynthesis
MRISAPCPVSILIPAKNERGNIEECIRSAQFAEEIVVVDSQSTDGTPDLALMLGAQVVDFVWNGSYPKKKNWALQNIPWRHDWVFILDADERITSDLAAEIRTCVSQSASDGFYVNRRFWFLDGWLKHCGYYPSWNLRLFKHALGRYEQPTGADQSKSGDNEVHEHVVLNGPVGWLKADMEHYAFPSIEVWIEKHNRYSNWEARIALEADQAQVADHKLAPALAHKRRLKSLAQRLPFRPLLRFFYHYVLRAGFLDGYRGYVFCRLMGMYEFWNLSKRRELRRRADS